MQLKDFENNFLDVARRYNSALIRLSPTTSDGSSGSLSTFLLLLQRGLPTDIFLGKDAFRRVAQGRINPAGNNAYLSVRAVYRKKGSVASPVLVLAIINSFLFFTR